MNYLSPQFYIKSTSDEGHIEGYASVFNVRDEQGELVEQGAFEKSLKKIQKNGKYPKLLWQHDVKKPIGVWEEVSEDAHGLFVKGRLLLEIKEAREIWALLKNKAVDGLSIGYKGVQKKDHPDYTALTNIDLMEISIVTFPACSGAKIESVKSAESEKKKSKRKKEVEEEQGETDLKIDTFAEIVKAISRLTQTIYSFLK